MGDRTLTILLGNPSTLPDPAPPPPPAPPTPEQIANWAARQAEAAQIRFIIAGATVYNHSETRLRWTDGKSGKSYEAWSNIDFNHLNQLSAEDNARIPFLSFLFVSDVDTVLLSQRLQHAVAVPAHPPLPADGPGFVIVAGDTTDLEAIAPIHALHDFYRAEQERLAGGYFERERLRAESAATAAAAPVAAKDNVMWFRPRKGSRYLPQEVQEEGAGQ
ncbi:hypothetical protein [Luteolibacter sp. Populi]|uniref:hypothetical protein n=1 Tax=Luteolibacter sp. Populi TaxID=3230487 RepID=UPI0034666995